jgi:hypothetical protein
MGPPEAVTSDNTFAHRKRRTFKATLELASVVLPAGVRRGGSARWAIHQISAKGLALIDPWRYAEAAIATTGEALSSVLSALARTPDFSELADAPDVRALYLGREVQRENARLLFGVENLPKAACTTGVIGRWISRC